MQARYALVLAAHSETTTIDTSFLVCPPILPLTQLAMRAWLRPDDCCNMVGNFLLRKL
jgi:hypothetical protein